MMKAFMAGARIRMQIKPVGTIASVTGATNKDGTITLFDLNFDVVMKQPKNFMKLQRLEKVPFKKSGPELNKIAGVTIPTDDVVVITYTK